MTSTLSDKQSLVLAVEPQAGRRKLSTAKAMQEAISQRMAQDESVFVMGEDVGAYGGIFSSTTGLLDRFGPERVRDTPIFCPREWKYANVWDQLESSFTERVNLPSGYS